MWSSLIGPEVQILCLPYVKNLAKTEFGSLVKLVDRNHDLPSESPTSNGPLCLYPLYIYLISLCQVYLGAGGNSIAQAQAEVYSKKKSDWGGPGETFAWKRKFRALEVVIHYKYNKRRRRGRITTQRKDYDIALIRIDYPAVDLGSGKNTIIERSKSISVVLMTKVDLSNGC